MYNYLEFNGTQLNDAYIVTNITKSLLPARDIQTLDILSRHGEIFNGFKYDPFVIDVEILVVGNDVNDYIQLKRDLRDILNVKEEVVVALSADKFGFGFPKTEVKFIDKTPVEGLATVSIVFLQPYFYSKEFTTYENTPEAPNIMTIQNKGAEPVKPFMSIGFTKDAHFVQVENAATGEKILVGNYPALELPSRPRDVKILYDNCESPSTWTQSSASIDNYRGIGGTLGVTANGKGLKLATIPNVNTVWKGACYRQNLSEALDEFEVSCRMDCKSSGVNGDPTIKDVQTETIVTGTKKTLYVTTASSLNIRKGPGTNYDKIGTVSKGYTIHEGVIDRGWVKFKYPDISGSKYGWCSADYVTKKIEDSTTTTTKQNFVTHQSTPLRASASLNSSCLITIPTGKVVRCISSKTYTSNHNGVTYEWYKLATAYNGKMGYVCVGNITRADKASIQYDENTTVNTADDKTGTVELYGFDANGKKLFCLQMYDNAPYYEYTRPELTIGTKNIITEQNPPPPKKVTTHQTSSDGSTNIKITNYLSGAYGSWNDFYGNLLVRRTRDSKGNYVWKLEVTKISAGVVTKKTLKDNIRDDTLPTEQLAYVVLYLGTGATDLKKSCDIALTELTVKQLNYTDPVVQNVQYFHAGDVLDLDFENRKAYLNGTDVSNLVDIGSRYFDVGTGDVPINIISDDSNIVVGATINNKWIGDV